MQWYFQEVKRELNGNDVVISPPNADESEAEPQPTSNETKVPPSLAPNPTNKEQEEQAAESTPTGANEEPTPSSGE